MNFYLILETHGEYTMKKTQCCVKTPDIIVAGLTYDLAYFLLSFHCRITFHMGKRS